MHRSGTSALARVLSLLGCGLPDNLMPALADNNETGFWESRDIADFNDRLLATAGSQWDDWRALPTAWLASPATAAWQPKARELLHHSFAGQPVIVLKDPRICRLVPFWLQVLDEAGYQTRLVLPLRHPLEVADSLRRRDGFSADKGQVLWLRHVLDAERDSRGRPRVLVNYADLLNDWRAVIGRLAADLQLGLPRWSATAEVEIDAFLRDDLRHNQASADLATHPRVSGWIKKTYQALLKLTETGPPPISGDSRNMDKGLDQDYDQVLDQVLDQTPDQGLDQIRAEFDHASQLFGGILRGEEMAREAESSAREADRLAREQAEHAYRRLEVRHQEDQQQIQALGDHLRDSEQERGRLAGDVLASHQQLQIASTRGDQLEARNAQLSQQVTREQQRAARWQQRFVNGHQRLGLLERLEASRRGALVDLRNAVYAQRTAAGALNAARLDDVQQHQVQREALAVSAAEVQARESARLVARDLVERRTAWAERTAGLQGHQSWRLLRILLGIEQRLPRLTRALLAFADLGLAALRLRLPARLRHRRAVRRVLATGLFDTLWYAIRYSDSLRLGIRPIDHWVSIGHQGGYQPHPLFDTDFYHHQVPKLRAMGANPLEHFLAFGAREACAPHPLFQPDWYLARYPDVAEAGVNPLLHFVTSGGQQGRAPHPLFDSAWYLTSYPDVAEAGVNPLMHYIGRGSLEGREPHPLFAGQWYLCEHPDVAAAGENPLLHYLRAGRFEGRQPHPLFDAGWYLASYPDVVTAGVEPLTHFIDTGAREGRAPHPLFDTRWYCHADVAASGLNPLVHFLTQGAVEGRDPHPLFACDWYRQRHPQVEQAAGGNALLHYERWGRALDANPHPLFDTSWYRRQHPDLADQDPLRHFLAQGEREGRAPHPRFDPRHYRAGCGDNSPEYPLRDCLSRPDGPDPHPLFAARWYLAENPDVAAAGQHPLLHFVCWGAAQGRRPHPLFDTAWYLERNPDIPPACNALVHYLEQGAWEGRDPNPLFASTWYLEAHPSLRETGVNPLLDYLARGREPGVNPHPLFDGSWYLQQYPDVEQAGENPLAHYLRCGEREGRMPHPLLGSEAPHPLFDADWYLEQSPELLASGQHPLLHFVLEGAFGGCHPHPLFDSAFYLRQNPSLVEQGMNPLVHYLRWGAWEEQDPHPLFDTSWYLEHHPQLCDQRLNPLEHYLRWGGVAGLDPHPLFAAAWYLEQYPEIAAAGLNPLVHFLRWGGREGRQPHPLFDSAWYLQENPDVEETGANPLLHYLQRGVAEGRNPHPLFHTAWYVSRHRELLETGENPLIHYLRQGAWQGAKPNPWFDSAWYLEQCPDVAASGQNPLIHYLASGGFGDCHPSAAFDNRWYRNHNPDVAAAGLNPLLHYLRTGIHEGRQPNPEGLLPTPVSAGHGRLYDQMRQRAEPRFAPEDYCPADDLHLDPQRLPLRAIAFYLPQFHPIPENDAWWGPGFTEWTNVTRAVPQFEGHDQPRLPDALGFYDLRLTEVQREQIRLARQHGIHGFCYYYYWFGGRRLLERPLLQMLADPSLDFPFCLCWANENWTRRWDGGDETVLIGQRHSPEDDRAFLASIAPALLDSRYIRIDERPLLLIYRPQLLPDPAATVQRWREQARTSGLGELYLVAVRSFTDALDPTAHGFDAGVEFPPHQVDFVEISPQFDFLNPQFSGHIYDYESCVRAAERQAAREVDTDADFFPGVMLAWDNSARRGASATLFAKATPEAYGRWLHAACARRLRREQQDQRLVFINAWNEWAEGTYLEPDRHYGYAWLQRTRAVLSEVTDVPVTARQEWLSTSAKPAPQLLYVGHDAHPHGAQLLTLHLLRRFIRRFGYQVQLWLLGDGELLDAYRQSGAEVQLLKASDGQFTRAGEKAMQAGIDRAIVNTVVSGAVLPQLNACGIRSLALVHEMPELIRERGLEPQARLCASQAETLVFAAERVRAAFASLAPIDTERSLILPQGIYQDLTPPPEARARVEAELGLSPEAILVINVGYGDRRKGVDLFLEVARHTAMQDARFHFLWVGHLEPGLDQRFAREQRQGRLITHLHHVPFTADIARYYAAANLFLLTSREDPFPSVVLEALCCGLPVVAFANSGGHCELFSQAGRVPQGLLVEPPGDIAALSAAVQRTAMVESQHPDWAAARAEAAGARFDFTDYAWQLLQRLDASLMRISILVPNYNYADYLNERLGSLFAQQYPVFEIIVLDDASSDASAAEIQRCAERWKRDLRLIANRQNSGSVFAQWARGVREARGELIWIAEADDLAEPQFLPALAPRFAADPQLTLAFCDSAQIDSQGHQLADSYAEYCNLDTELDFRTDFSLDARDFLRQGLSVKNPLLNVSGVLLRREPLMKAMERLGWLPQGDDQQATSAKTHQWRIAGDWRLYIELCRLGGRVTYLAQALNQHRRHQASVVGRHQLEDHIEEIRRIHRLLRPDLGADPAIADRQQSYLAELEARVSDS
jgi:hypothetical protein